MTRGRDRVFPFNFGGKNWGCRIPFKTTNQNPTNGTPTDPVNTWSCNFRNRRGTRAEGNRSETTTEGQRETNPNVDREWVPYVDFQHRLAKTNVTSSSSKTLTFGAECRLTPCFWKQSAKADGDYESGAPVKWMGDQRRYAKFQSFFQ